MLPAYDSDELVVFLGHADDANDLAAVVRQTLEERLGKELRGLAQAAGKDARFRRVRVYDWPRDAVGQVGGQLDVIDPVLERADIAIFLFRWRVGKVTWEHELADALKATHRPLLYCAFPADVPPPELQRSREGAKAWSDLLDKRASLTDGYVNPGATCVVSLRDYRDEKDLCDELVEKMKDCLPILVRRGGSAERLLPGPASLDIVAYSRRMEALYGRLDLEALLPPERDDGVQLRLPEVFVEPSVREERPPVELPKEILERLQQDGEVGKDVLPQGLRPEDVERARSSFRERPRVPVFDLLARPGQQGTVLLGDPGCGKSTLTRYMLLSLLDPNGNPRVRAAFPGVLPLLIEVRQYAAQCRKDGCETFVDFLDWLGHTEGYGLNREGIEAHIASRAPTLLIFDGLDEVFDPELRDTIVRRIAGCAADHRHVRIVVTSRVVGYSAQALQSAGFAHATIQELDDDQIRRFSEVWFRQIHPRQPDEAALRRERIRVAVASSPSIRQIAGNPMLLTIMAIISRHQELPRDRAALYEHAVSVLVQHWDVRKRLKDENLDAPHIEKAEKLELLRRIAWRMQSGPRGLAGNFLHGSDLHDEIEAYLRERFEETPARAAAIAKAMVHQLRERNFLLCRWGAEVYGFVHRSFLEFCCATAILQRFEKTHELDIESLKRDFFGAHWTDPSWAEVLRLIAGQLDPRFAAQVIDFLAHDAYPSWPCVFGDRPPRNLVLAVQCLGEVRNPRPLEEVGGRLLRQVLRLLEHGDGVNDENLETMLQEDLVPAAREVGVAWPGRDACMRWFFERGPTLVWGQVSWCWCQLAAAVFHDSEDMERHVSAMAHSSDSRLTHSAAEALGYVWTRRLPPFLRLRALVLSEVPDELRVVTVSVMARGYSGEPECLVLLKDCAKSDRSAWVRRSSLKPLASSFRDDPDVPILLKALAKDDPDTVVRADSIKSLASFFCNDPEVPVLLKERAELDPASNVRAAALISLARSLGDDPDVPVLLKERSEADPDTWVRRTTFDTLARSFGGDPDVPVLLKKHAKADPEIWVRRNAIELLADLFRDDPEVPMLLKAFARDDPDYQVRSAALESLARSFRDDPDVSMLLKAFAKVGPDTEVRSSSIESLARSFGDDPDVLILLKAFLKDDPDPRVRSSSLESLVSSFRDDPEVTILVKVIAKDDSDSEVRRAAVEALGGTYISDPEVPALLKECVRHDTACIVRRESIWGLANTSRTDPEVPDLLKELAKGDLDSEVRSASIWALANTSPADPEVAHLLKSVMGNDEDFDVRRSSVWALVNRFRTDPELPALLKDRAQNDPDSKVRLASVQAMSVSSLSDPELPRLSKNWALKDPDPGVRGAANCLWARCAGEPVFCQLVTQDLDGFEPYLDPSEPLSDDHVLRAAKAFHLSPDDMGRLLDRMTSLLGWDPRKGFKPAEVGPSAG